MLSPGEKNISTRRVSLKMFRFAEQIRFDIFLSDSVCSNTDAVRLNYRHHPNSNLGRTTFLNSMHRGRSSNRRIPKRAQHGVDARLVALALRFEPLQHILIDAQGNCCFGRGRLQATADYAANDAAHGNLGVLFCGLCGRRFIAQASPIGFRLWFRGSRGPLHGAWLCGRR
jgi:hypothetical protein